VSCNGGASSATSMPTVNLDANRGKGNNESGQRAKQPKTRIEARRTAALNAGIGGDRWRVDSVGDSLLVGLSPPNKQASGRNDQRSNSSQRSIKLASSITIASTRKRPDSPATHPDPPSSSCPSRTLSQTHHSHPSGGRHSRAH
jgi:hypothetical protein